jgi:hypothetical protein
VGGFEFLGSGDTQRHACTDEPVTFSSQINIEEICTLNIRDFGRLSALYREHACGTRTLPVLTGCGGKGWTQVSSHVDEIGGWWFEPQIGTWGRIWA